MLFRSRLRSMGVLLGALIAVAAGAQDKEPSAKEMYEAYAGYWDGVSQSLKKCKSGELKGLQCAGPATSGVTEIKVLALDKYKCVVARDRNGHNCTFKPEVEVRGSNEAMARALQGSLNGQKTNLFRRVSGTMIVEPRSDQ